MADFAADPYSFTALTTMWQTMGRGPRADRALIDVANNADRAENLPAKEALAASVADDTAAAPVVATTEQQVANINANLGAGRHKLEAVYPRDSSPTLTYPIVDLNSDTRSMYKAAAVAQIHRRLTSQSTKILLKQKGFRVGQTQSSSRVNSSGNQGLSPRMSDLNAVGDRLSKLARRSRILILVDVSLSMRGMLDDRRRRIDVASGAIRLSAGVLPDRSSVGVWSFARRMHGDKDWQVDVPMAPLSYRDQGRTQRQLLVHSANQLPGDLHKGGTALYDTVSAAIGYMYQTYDPGAVNAIILLTDGSNNDPGGTTLSSLLRKIRQLNAQGQSVLMFATGLGRDVDLPVLQKIAVSTGAFANSINTSAEGRAALLDGIRKNRNLD